MLMAIVLLLAGLAVSLLGYKLFMILLPFIGLVGGTMVGFVGFQSVFGKGVISTTVAIFVAVIVGVLLALLSFLFFSFTVTLYTALLGASAFSYLGIALGLGSSGFLLFALGVFGFILGLILASNVGFSDRLVMALTSFIGVAFILASVFLIAGKVSVEGLNETGVIQSVAKVVDQSFLWFFVWFGGAMVAIAFQRKTLPVVVMGDQFVYDPSKQK